MQQVFIQMNVLTAHQPVYLPWLGLFHKIALADEFVYFDMVQYLKKDWNNRNKINTVNGPIWLTVPVLTKGKFYQKLSEVKINNQLPWRKQHWSSIYFNYKKTPYFADYEQDLKAFYDREWEYLNDLNREMLQYFLKVLGIKTTWIEGSPLQLQGQKSDLVLDMCKKLKSDLYIFGALGKEYAQVDAFAKENIKIYFQDYSHPTYKQQFPKPFESHLSIIDLLCNHGKDSLNILMQGNIARQELIESFKRV